MNAIVLILKSFILKNEIEAFTYLKLIMYIIKKIY